MSLYLIGTSAADERLQVPLLIHHIRKHINQYSNKQKNLTKMTLTKKQKQKKKKKKEKKKIFLKHSLTRILSTFRI